MPNPRSVFSLFAHIYALAFGALIGLMFAFAMLASGQPGFASNYSFFSPWLLLLIGGLLGTLGYKFESMTLHIVASGLYILDLVLLHTLLEGPTPFDEFVLYPTIAASAIGLFKKKNVQPN